MSACGCMQKKNFPKSKLRGLSGDDFAANVASFAVFDEAAGDGVGGFPMRTVAMSALVYAVARTAGPRDFLNLPGAYDRELA